MKKIITKDRTSYKQKLRLDSILMGISQISMEVFLL